MMRRAQLAAEEGGAAASGVGDGLDEEEDDWGAGRGVRGKQGKKAAREEALMLGLGSYASDDDEEEDDEEEEETDDDDEGEEEDDDDGTTNIYPGTGDADVDGVGQHAGTQV
jgi:hypothetical protein